MRKISAANTALVAALWNLVYVLNVAASILTKVTTMACEKCAERRDKLREAVLRGKLLQAAGHVVAGVKEMMHVDRDRPSEVGSGDEGTPDGDRPHRRARFGRRNKQDDT